VPTCAAISAVTKRGVSRAQEDGQSKDERHGQIRRHQLRADRASCRRGGTTSPSTSSARTSGSTWPRSAAMPRPSAIAWKSQARCQNAKLLRPSGRRGSG